jgi:thiosulfate/3-mercaptopyruvate sulfurtransferase
VGTEHEVLVDAAWLHQHLGDGDLVIIDATTHNVIPEDGPFSPESGHGSFSSEHIPGAVFADLLGAFADPHSDEPWTVPTSERFAEAAGALGIGDGVRVVVYDQHQGFWATRFWWHLRLEGFDHVAVLDGGLGAWKAAGLPVTSAESAGRSGTFVPHRRPGLLRSTEAVAAALDDDSTLLINVVDAATYRGDANTYPRRGHIPGSINLPVAELREAGAGTLRSAGDLRRMFDAAGLLDSSKSVVTYCGGGIAATGVAHALAMVGRHDVAVYDGSMTAWSANPELPLVTGDSPR